MRFLIAIAAMLTLSACLDVHSSASATLSMLQSCGRSCMFNGGIEYIIVQDWYNSGSRVGYTMKCTCANGGTFDIQERLKQ